MATHCQKPSPATYVCESVVVRAVVNRCEDGVGLFAALGILAGLASAAAVVVLPWLIGVFFTDPAVVAGAFVL